MRLVLLLLLIAETLALIGIPYAQMTYTGGFQYGCATLQFSMISNESMGGGLVSYSCPSGPAMYLTPGLDCAVRENPCTRITPHFARPPGLLELYLGVFGSRCQESLQLFFGSPGRSLISGSEMAYLQPPLQGVDYCASWAASVQVAGGFTITWSLG